MRRSRYDTTAATSGTRHGDRHTILSSCPLAQLHFYGLRSRRAHLFLRKWTAMPMITAGGRQRRPPATRQRVCGGPEENNESNEKL